MFQITQCIYQRNNNSNVPKDLYFAKHVIKNYKTEDQLRAASKSELEVIKETLQTEIQYQNSGKGMFLTSVGLLFALVAIMIPYLFIQPSQASLKIEDTNYELSNITLQDKDTGQTKTYVEIDDDKIFLKNTVVGIIFSYLLLIGVYYIWASIKLKKLNDLYSLAKFVRSLK